MYEGEFSIEEGGCACREVRYRMHREPMFVHCCHCTWCQRETGSAFVLNAIIEAGQVELLQGGPVMVNTPSASGKGQRIARCPSCQVALWSNYAGAGETVSFLRIGSLDNPGRFRPDIHIFTSTRQPWVTLEGDVPIVPEYYDPRERWPEESIRRYRIAQGKA